MTSRTGVAWICLIGVLIAVGGCARAARDTTAFAITDSATVDVPPMTAWQATRDVLRDQGFDIYTRDRRQDRGVFVAFTKMKRSLFFVPHRTKYTVALEGLSANQTRVTVESIDQVYGSTLLTYPAWHDRKTTDNAQGKALLEAIEAEAGGTGSEQG